MSDVTNNPARHRYQIVVDGETAFAAYRDESDVRVFTHTEVPPELGGRGIGTRLIAGALEDVRKSGKRVLPLCAFVRGFIERNPAFSDLLER